MWIENSGQAFLLSLLAALSRENARDLGEDSDRVYRVDVRDDVTVRILVLEEESTEVRLTPAHHLLDCSNDSGIADDDSLVKTREEGTTSDRERKDLRVRFRHRLLGY